MTIKEPLIFIGGAVTGSLISYFVAKRHFEKILNTELRYREENEELKLKARTKPDLDELAKNLDTDEDTLEPTVVKKDTGTEDYSVYDTTTKEEPEDPVVTEEIPDYEIIVAEDFQLNDGYDKLSLLFYYDEILANETTDDVLDIEETIGNPRWLDAIDGDTAATIYIRNNKTQTDYEINYSEKTFTEATGIFIRE